jgi:hypothetical protein
MALAGREEVLGSGELLFDVFRLVECPMWSQGHRRASWGAFGVDTDMRLREGRSILRRGTSRTIDVTCSSIHDLELTAILPGNVTPFHACCVVLSDGIYATPSVGKYDSSGHDLSS